MTLTIAENIPLKDGHFLLSLIGPSSLLAARPGQFLHLRIGDTSDPLLRRPLSIHDVAPLPRRRGAVVKILYKAVGRGTRLLSEKKSSCELDALGPLGRGFAWEAWKKTSHIYLVAGGMGVAPLFFLVKKLVHSPCLSLPRRPASSAKRGEQAGGRQAQSSVHGKIVVVLGAKTKNSIFCEKEFKKLGCLVHVATEDGSKGFKGTAPDLLEHLYLSSASRPLSTVVCACGPKPMLAVLSDIARSAAVPAWVSLEEFMGCGLGACLGCVIRTQTGYKRVCHDGPVFDASEIIWRD